MDSQGQKWNSMGNPPRMFGTGVRSALAAQVALAVSRRGAFSAQTDDSGNPIGRRAVGWLRDNRADVMRTADGSVRSKESDRKRPTGPTERRDEQWNERMAHLWQGRVDSSG